MCDAGIQGNLPSGDDTRLGCLSSRSTGVNSFVVRMQIRATLDFILSQTPANTRSTERDLSSRFKGKSSSLFNKKRTARVTEPGLRNVRENAHIAGISDTNVPP